MQMIDGGGFLGSAEKFAVLFAGGERCPHSGWNLRKGRQGERLVRLSEHANS